MRVAVLGATGQAGRTVSRLLLQEAAIDVVACGRNDERLDALAASLSGSGSALTTTVCELSDEARLREVLASVDVVVGATSRWTDGPRIATQAIEAGTSYLGLYLSSPQKWQQLRALEAASRDRGIAVVDDGGVHPGLPGSMIRFANDESPLASAWVGGKLSVNWRARRFAPETVRDFAAELGLMDPALMRDREWVRGYRHSRRFDFGDGRGPVSCVPMCLEEVREVANEFPELQSTGFFIAGFGSVVDYGVLPLALALGSVRSRTASRILLWGLRQFASSSEDAALVLEGVALDGRRITLKVSHPDPYLLTGIPVVATIRQILAAPKPGVWTQSAFVEPRRFFQDVERLGASVTFPADVLNAEMIELG